MKTRQSNPNLKKNISPTMSPSRGGDDDDEEAMMKTRQQRNLRPLSDPDQEDMMLKTRQSNPNLQKNLGPEYRSPNRRGSSEDEAMMKTGQFDRGGGIQPVQAIAASSIGDPDGDVLARPVRAVMLNQGAGLGSCVAPTPEEPPELTSWTKPKLYGLPEKHSCAFTPAACCWSYLCSWHRHKACEKSMIQCCCSYTFCMCCIVPDAHRVVFGSHANNFNWLCCALCGCQDCMLLAVPFVGAVGLIEPFKWAAVYHMRRQIIEKYRINESSGCSWLAANCLCFCAAMVQQTNELFIREDLELSGSFCCACGVQKRYVAQPTPVVQCMPTHPHAFSRFSGFR